MGCQVILRPQTYNDVLSGKDIVFCDSCQRVLYLSPKDEIVEKKEAVHRPKRHHPKIDAPQAWYYRPEFANDGEVFLCLTNAGGQASRRVYDIHTGRLLGDILIREGNYREAFPEDITGSTRLNGNWSEEELDNFGSELPMVILDSLNSDLDAARLEAASGSHAKHESPAAPTPAAS
jgi:C4-type zinc ribbon protein